MLFFNTYIHILNENDTKKLELPSSTSIKINKE